MRLAFHWIHRLNGWRRIFYVNYALAPSQQYTGSYQYAQGATFHEIHWVGTLHFALLACIYVCLRRLRTAFVGIKVAKYLNEVSKHCMLSSMYSFTWSFTFLCAGAGQVALAAARRSRWRRGALITISYGSALDWLDKLNWTTESGWSTNCLESSAKNDEKYLLSFHQSTVYLSIQPRGPILTHLNWKRKRNLSHENLFHVFLTCRDAAYGNLTSTLYSFIES